MPSVPFLILASIYAAALYGAVLWLWEKGEERSARAHQARVTQLLSERATRTRADFFDPLRGRGVPEEILETIHAFFQEWIGVKDFPVLPEDDFEEVYRILGEISGVK